VEHGTLSHSIPTSLGKYRSHEINAIRKNLLKLLSDEEARGLSIFGGEGVGKTACFLIAKDDIERTIEKSGDSARIVYFTSQRWESILYNVCLELGIDVKPDRRISEYISALKNFRDPLVLCLDGIDGVLRYTRLEAERVLYVLSRLRNVRLVAISRVGPLSDNSVYFRPYTRMECRNILLEWMKLQFRGIALEEESIDLLAEIIAEEGGNIRKGLEILELCRSWGSPITARDMLYIVELHNVGKKFQSLSMSERLILVATQVTSENGRATTLENVFKRQNNIRASLGLEPIEKSLFSKYVMRLAVKGFLTIERRGSEILVKTDVCNRELRKTRLSVEKK